MFPRRVQDLGLRLGLGDDVDLKAGGILLSNRVLVKGPPPHKLVTSGGSILGDRELASALGVGIIGVFAVTRVSKVKHRQCLAQPIATTGNILTGLENLIGLAGPKDGHLGAFSSTDEVSVSLPVHGKGLTWVGLGEGEVWGLVVGLVLVEEEGVLGAWLAERGGVVAGGDEVGVDSVDVAVGARGVVCSITCTFSGREGLDAVNPGVGFGEGGGAQEGGAQEEGGEC